MTKTKTPVADIPETPEEEETSEETSNETTEGDTPEVPSNESRLAALEEKMKAFEDFVIHGGHGMEKVKTLWKEKFGG